MIRRAKKYEDISSTDFLLLREKLGFKRYRKTLMRNAEKRRILLDIALKKIEEKEKEDFILLGYRRRRLKVF
jgi:5-methylcytosine-specific restriction endonuclease McrBC GTP-binding regulatory subunit McrB